MKTDDFYLKLPIRNTSYKLLDTSYITMNHSHASSLFLIGALLLAVCFWTVAPAVYAQDAGETVSAPTGTQVAPQPSGKGNTTVGYGLKNPMGTRTIPQIIGAVIGWVSGLAGALFMLYLIWGGIEWMTAGGSSDRLKKGQQKIIYAIFGIVIVVTAYFIVDAVIGLTNIPPGT
jgi:hypothetical protein